MPSVAASQSSDRARVRRARGHYCAQCRRPWALEAERSETDHPSGARLVAWVVRCRHCDYQRSQIVVVEVHGDAAGTPSATAV